MAERSIEVNMNDIEINIPPHSVTGELIEEVDFYRIEIATVHDFPIATPSSTPPEGVSHQVENVAVRIDGKYITSVYGPLKPHKVWNTWDQANRIIYSHIVIDKRALHIGAGDHEITVSLWPAKPFASKRAIAYLKFNCSVQHTRIPTLNDNFITNMFTLRPYDGIQGKLDINVLRQSGINTLAEGVFINPGYGSMTYEQWKTASIGRLSASLKYCKDNGFLFLGIGDDFLRIQEHKDWIVNSEWSAQAIRETCELLVNSGICIGLNGVDEAALASDDPALAKFNEAWRSVPNYPPVAYPAVGHAEPPFNLEDRSIADFAIRYISPILWDRGRPEAWSIADWVHSIDRQSKMRPIGMPWMMQLSCSGPYYYKRINNPEYTPGTDDLIAMGLNAPDIIAQAWAIVCYGACGLVAYSYDSPMWVDERKNAPLGKDCQTGTKPGDSRWIGIYRSFITIRDRWDHIKNANFSPPAMHGPFLCNTFGQLKVAVNATDVGQYGSFGNSGYVLSVDGAIPYTGQIIPVGGVWVSL